MCLVFRGIMRLNAQDVVDDGVRWGKFLSITCITVDIYGPRL